MTRRPAHDVSEGWPEEAGNEELARLGGELFAGRPELSQIALDRIRVRMGSEIERVGRRRRLRTIVATATACAAIGVGAWAWVKSNASRPAAPSSNAATAPAAVRDTFDVTLPSETPRAPDKPIIDVEAQKKLFEKEGKK